MTPRAWACDCPIHEVRNASRGGRKSGPVVARNFVDRDCREIDQAGRRRAAAFATLANVTKRECETGSAVVVLLGDDAVEAHDPVAEIVERRAPQFQAEAAATIRASR